MICQSAPPPKTVPRISGPENSPPLIGTMRRRPLPTSPRSSGASTVTWAAKMKSSRGAGRSGIAFSPFVVIACIVRGIFVDITFSAAQRSRTIMDVRAAVATAPGKPLEVTTVQLEGPRAGEVLVEIKATGICHTDEFTLSGADPEGLFPAILGHEGAGIIVDIGPGVTSVKKGDHVIPLYTPECRQCPSCLSRKTNLCTAIRATQGQGLMPDGTSRFSRGGERLFHYMGCSTFSNFTVLPEIAVAKVNPDAAFDTICYIGCGVTTGIGAVINTAKVEQGATAIVFGLGGI